MVTDVAGFAASLALRGLRWIAVPTTVLSMVDASVGGKTAVDLGSAKNAVGAFHQPSRVIVDPTLSATETARAYRSGLAEVVKTALIGDPDWVQIMADALGRPVTTSGVKEASLRGAAVMALERLGATPAPAPLGALVEPRRDKVEAFRAARERQRRLYEVVTSEPTS